MMGRLQFWLQRRKWWPACWFGNRISDIRYWLWRARGGKWPEYGCCEDGPHAPGLYYVSPGYLTIDTRYPNAASNTGSEPSS